MSGTLNGVDADSTNSVYNNPVAGTRVSGIDIDRRTPSGRNTTGNNGGFVKGHLGRKGNHTGGGDDVPLGERAEQVDGADALPTTVQALRAVKHGSRHKERSVVAQVGLAGDTEATAPARRHPRGDEGVASLEVSNARTDLFNDSGSLVTAHHGWSESEIAVAEVLIGVAQARVVKPNENFALFGCVEFELFDFVVSCFFPHHSGACLHSFSLRANGVLREFCNTRRINVNSSHDLLGLERLAMRSQHQNIPNNQGMRALLFWNSIVDS